MDASAKLPASDVVGHMLSGLVDRRVVAKRVPPMSRTDVRGVASFADADGQLRFLALCDAAFLASTGAALSLIPVVQVTDAIKSGSLPPTIIENAFEVMNILSTLFNEIEGATHVNIERLDLAPRFADRVKVAMGKPGPSLELELEITGYPKGRLSLVAVKDGG